MKRVVVLAALAVSFGCGSKKQQRTNKHDDPHKSGVVDLSASNKSSTASLLTSFLRKAKDKPGPYDEPRASADYAAHKPHYAVLELTGEVAEVPSFSIIGGSSGTPLRLITDRLHSLGENEKVLGLVVRAGNLGIDMAKAEELRAALIRFKSAGEHKRTVVCHTEGMTNASYYVFSACDRLVLAPTGEVVLSGVAAMPMHIKGLLDKLGVHAQFLHVGAFKGAAEPLTRDAPSPEMVQTLRAILDQAYATLVSGVASARKLPEEKVRALIDEAVFPDKRAVEAKLVDAIDVFEQFRSKAVAGKPWTRVKLGEDRSSGLAGLMEFIGMVPKARPAGPRVGIIYAVGGVEDGNGGRGLRGRSVIASRPMSAAIRAMARNDEIKAIVIRVSSGGGSALASEIIWHAVVAAKAKKPVIVSMGGVAASGGYYIGCGATRIFAQQNTLTGSIGVVGGKLSLKDAAAKLGVKVFPLEKGKRALMWSAFASWNAAERKTVQTMMESVYKTFVTRVASGRHKSYDQVHAIAQGRVWTGAAAVKNGLVDAIGGLHEAVAEAKKLAKLPASAPVEVYPPEPTLMDYLGSLGGVSAPLGLRAAIASIAQQFGSAAAAQVERVLSQLFLLRGSHVLAAMMLPVVIR